MDYKEMIDLIIEFSPDMKVSRMIRDPEVYDGGCEYCLTYKGIVCGSELVSAGFVREYIKRHIK